MFPCSPLQANKDRLKLSIHIFLTLVFHQCRYIVILDIVTSLNSFSNSEFDVCPRIDEATTDLARDLELPGFPTRKRGILSSMQIVIMKMFSLRAAFRAMLWPSSMLSKSTSWHLYTINYSSQQAVQITVLIVTINQYICL